jgi:hypothetical protein
MKKKREGWDALGKVKVAEMPAELGWHVPRNSRSIDEGMAVSAYICIMRVSESIHSPCLKSHIVDKRNTFEIKLN